MSWCYSNAECFPLAPFPLSGKLTRGSLLYRCFAVDTFVSDINRPKDYDNMNINFVCSAFLYVAMYVANKEDTVRAYV